MSRLVVARGTGSQGISVGWDVVVLIGQSNMAGPATGYDAETTDPVDPRIWQYASSGTNANQIIVATEPLWMVSHQAGGMGPGLQFARWYVESVPGRKVLLVPAALAGTGFASTSASPVPDGYIAGPGTWSPNGPGLNLYDRAVTQANAAIAAAGPNARVAAFLWHQGEADIPVLDEAQYAAHLDQLIDALRANVTGASSAPFVVGGFVPEIAGVGSSGAAIDRAHRATPSRKLRTAFAPGISGAHDGVHYTEPGMRALGLSMFDALARARGNT